MIAFFSKLYPFRDIFYITITTQSFNSFTSIFLIIKPKDLTKNCMILRFHHRIFLIYRKLIHFLTLCTHFLNLLYNEFITNQLIYKLNFQLIIIIKSKLYMQPNNYPNQNVYNYQQQQPVNNNNNVNRQPPPNYFNPPMSNNNYLSPQATNQGNFNNFQPNIQTSISPNNKPNNFGSNKLSSMGRFIKEQPDMNHRSQQTPSNFLQPTTYQQQKLKMASSMIFQKNNNDDFNRFPGFNVGNSQQNNTGGSKLDAFLNRKNQQEPIKQKLTNQTPQQKRKRQIQQIKNQFAMINKKLETKIVTKQQGGQTKQYFQLPTRKTTQLTPNQMSQQLQTIRQQQSNKPQDSNFSVFNKYAKGSISQATSVSSNQSKTYTQNKNISPNYTQKNYTLESNSYGATNQTQNKNITTNYTQKNYSNQYTSPLTNNLPPSTNYLSSQPAKQQGGGMFKKKNLYINEEINVDNSKKAFILSPKASLNNPVKIQTFQSKPAQVILPTQPKKGFKRSDSIQNVEPQVQEKPKVFQKSDFKIGKKMGKGQFGQVMLVQHKITGFLCGMKVMSKKQIRQQKYVNQIARELSIQFYLNHRNVAPLYGYFQDTQNVYLLVQFCTGGQLLQMLRKTHRMQENDTSPIIRQICEGLDYIHKEEIIHRDIKPQNILFNFNTVKICDFGWAVHCGTGMRKTVSGSPLYYSPEVVMETQYDEKVDIWAIGMMTYECLLGKIPFKIYSELDLNRIVSDQVKFPEYVDVTDDAKDFILGIMKKNPQDRMGMKQIFKHPFIRKYLQEKKVASETLEQFKRILN